MDFFMKIKLNYMYNDSVQCLEHNKVTIKWWPIFLLFAYNKNLKSSIFIIPKEN